MRRSTAVAALALVIACEGKKEPRPDSSAPAAAPAAATTPAPTAAAMIVSPKRGDTTGVDVAVVLTKQGVSIEKASGTRVEGVGHYHLFLDTPPSAEGQPIPPTTKQIVHIGSGDSTFTFKGLAPGQHEIIAVLGYGNHVPMPSRRDTVRFVVRR